MENGDRIEYNNAIFWEDPHETYTDITNPENILLEHNTWTIIHSAPVYQFIDYLNTVGRILWEGCEEITLEDGSYVLLEDGSGNILAEGFSSGLLLQENESFVPGGLHYDVQEGYFL